MSISNARLRAIADYESSGNGSWYILFKDGAELEYYLAGSAMNPNGVAG